MTATSYRTEKWDRVSHGEPCPICEHDGFCKITTDRMIAGCMRIKDGSYKTVPTALGEMYLHRLTDEPREPRPARPQPTEAPQRDVIADRAVYALVVATCATLPDFAEAELLRRFGIHWRAIATTQRIGYCAGPALLAAIEGAGRRREAIAAGVLNQDGTVSWSLLDRLVIPYLRDGLVHDLRGAGIKGRDETREISLRGSYAERGVADLFYHDDTLRALGPDGVLHLAGGAYKTMALLAAGLNAVALRGEAELSEGHAARLHAAGVRTIILHIDAEDAKEGQALSAGRRLGLQKAEKLAATGLTVAIAEPPHEPGTPKVDPDALLRDFGPRAVRDYAYSAIPLDAWRVVIGVAPAAISEEAAAEIKTWKQRCAKQQRTLTSVIQIRRNGAIKTERDTLTASALHMRAEQANGHMTPAGRIRQPLSVVAQAVGKTNPIASDHLRLGPENDLFDREVLKEVIIRAVDPATGERHETLRLINDRKEIVEECPTETVFGPAGAPFDERSDGVYYVTPRHEPEVILERLVVLAPVKTKKNGESKEQWGGKRCPRCGSTKTRTVTYCGDCDLLLKETKHTGDPPEMETVADISARLDEPQSIPPTPVEELAAEPLATVRDDQHGEADDWDPHFCNHLDHRGQQCTARIDPALGKRYCWQHRRVTPAPVAAAPPADVEPEPPPDAFVWPADVPPLVGEIIETPQGKIERFVL